MLMLGLMWRSAPVFVPCSMRELTFGGISLRSNERWTCSHHNQQQKIQKNYLDEWGASSEPVQEMNNSPAGILIKFRSPHRLWLWLDVTFPSWLWPCTLCGTFPGLLMVAALWLYTLSHITISIHGNKHCNHRQKTNLLALHVSQMQALWGEIVPRACSNPPSPQRHCESKQRIIIRDSRICTRIMWHTAAQVHTRQNIFYQITNCRVFV